MASLTLSVSSWIRTTELTDCTKTFTSSLCGTKCMCMCVYVCVCVCMCVYVLYVYILQCISRIHSVEAIAIYNVWVCDLNAFEYTSCVLIWTVNGKVYNRMPCVWSHQMCLVLTWDTPLCIASDDYKRPYMC